MKNAPSRSAAFLMLTASVAIWGASYPVTRYALRFFPPFLLGFLRYGLSVPVFALFPGGRAIPPRGERRTLLLLGLTGAFFFAAFMNLGMRFTTGISGSLLSGTPPLITALIARSALGEPLGAGRIAGLASGALGVLCVSGGSILSPSHSLSALAGNGCIMLAQLSWALYTVSARGAAERIEGAAAGAWTAIVGACCLLPLALAEPLWEQAPRVTPGAVLALLYLSALNTALAYLFWNSALHTVGASTAAAFQYLQPLSGAVVSVLMLGEGLSAALAVGAALILMGVFLVLRRDRSSRDKRSSQM